jgi:predicted Zn-dependent protease
MDRVAHFQALVVKQPQNELFRFSLAQALEAAERGEEAVEHYQICLQRKPDWMMARILLGKRLLALDRRPEARTELELGLRLAIEQQHEEPEQELRALLADLNR